MRYWWVNQNQTLDQEISGGYLWSPKQNRNGSRNQFYVNMTLVQSGDLVFSYANQHISTIGVAKGQAYEAPKPVEYGAAGQHWADTGWRVDVSWRGLKVGLRPKTIIDQLRPLLPEKYSPLQANGDGNQGVYLAAMNFRMTEVLLRHIDTEVQAFLQGQGVDAPDIGSAADEEVATSIADDDDLSQTEKEALIRARRGQGKFRINVSQVEKRCRLTGITNPRLLVASHIKPWRRCETNAERLDGHNGLLLTPDADHLFDKGLISFGNDGVVLISNSISSNELDRLGFGNIRTSNVGTFSTQQCQYLEFHRTCVFSLD
jgi:hypothetical protein